MVVWHSINSSGCINKVAVCYYWHECPCLDMQTSQPGQLSILPSVGWEMSISQSAPWWGVTHSICGCMYVWLMIFH